MAVNPPENTNNAPYFTIEKHTNESVENGVSNKGVTMQRSEKRAKITNPQTIPLGLFKDALLVSHCFF